MVEVRDSLNFRRLWVARVYVGFGVLDLVLKLPTALADCSVTVLGGLG